MALSISNYRYNPFTDTFTAYGYGYSGNPEESHTIPSSGPYWVYLNEIPRRDAPSTLAVTHDGGATVFTEVSFTTTPAAGQFRVVYGSEPDSTSGVIGSGIIEFNAADAGKDITVKYYGLGSILQKQFFTDLVSNLVKKVVEIGDWNMDINIFKNVAHGMADFKK